jgi:hypothetical protein
VTKSVVVMIALADDLGRIQLRSTVMLPSDKSSVVSTRLPAMTVPAGGRDPPSYNGSSSQLRPSAANPVLAAFTFHPTGAACFGDPRDACTLGEAPIADDADGAGEAADEGVGDG